MNSNALAPERKPRRLRRLLKFVLWSVGALVLVWTATFAIATWNRSDALAALKARGEPTSFAEAVARNDAKAGKPNELLKEAIEQHIAAGRPGMHFSRTDSGRAPTSVAAVQAGRIAANRQNPPLIKRLEQAAAAPPGPLDLTNRESAVTFRSAAEVIWLAQFAAVEFKDAESKEDWRVAFQRLRLILRIGDQLSEEPFLTQQINRLEIYDLARHLIGSASPIVVFTPKEFAELDRLLERVDREFLFAPALKSERLVVAAMFDGRPGTEERFLHGLLAARPARNWLDWNFERLGIAWAHAVVSPIGLPIRRKAAAETLSLPDDVLEFVDIPPPRPKELLKRFERSRLLLTHYRIGLSPPDGSLLEAAEKMTRYFHRRIAMARLALRMRRYHLQHKRLPDRLEELCDAAMPDLPTTWFEREPFLYERDGPKFHIQAAMRLQTDATWLDDGLHLKLDFSARSWNVDLLPRAP